MKIIISGTPASGKSSVAKLLAKKLGYRHFSMGDFQRELAQEHGVDIVEWGRLESMDPKYDRMVDERQAKIGQENDDFVIDSWLGAHFIPDAFKIFIDADRSVRAERRLKHKRTEEQYDTIGKVEAEMERREGYNKERWLRYYGFDYTDHKNYDLIIDSSKDSIEELTETIIKSLHLNMNDSSKDRTAS